VRIGSCVVPPEQGGADAALAYELPQQRYEADELHCIAHPVLAANQYLSGLDWTTVPDRLQPPRRNWLDERRAVAQRAIADAPCSRPISRSHLTQPLESVEFFAIAHHCSLYS
jgi:hypothetical protein